MSGKDDIRPEAMAHLTELDALSDGMIGWLIERAIEQKRTFKKTGKLTRSLKGKTLAMLFQKPSLRTRLGFEVAMTQLGGHAIFLDSQQIGLGGRETLADSTRVIASMCDGIMARVFDHAMITTLAEHSSVPVINGLSDTGHPCQALTDLMTLQEEFGGLAGLRLAYIGDGNNVARSLAIGCARTSVEFVIATPSGHGLDAGFVDGLNQRYGASSVTVADSPASAADGADGLYTDVWTSMGQEHEAQRRRPDFGGYQINAALVERAKPTAIVLHCLPAHRGEEITDDVLDGPGSRVFAQAENRLHLQRTLLAVLLG